MCSPTQMQVVSQINMLTREILTWSHLNVSNTIKARCLHKPGSFLHDLGCQARKACATSALRNVLQSQISAPQGNILQLKLSPTQMVPKSSSLWSWTALMVDTTAS
jgi:hypothetical protein